MAKGSASPNQHQSAETILVQWALLIAVVAVWMWQTRAWTDLGVALPLGWGFTVALGLALVAFVVMGLQWWDVYRKPEVAAKVRDQLRDVAGFVPSTPRELTVSRAMAVTAGICEEVVYRGYVLWYLTQYVPMAAAVPIMMVGFGALHLYQGFRPAVQIAGIGGLFAFFYLLSGSVWIPIALHVVVDLWQLALARAALDGEGDEPAPAVA